MNYFFKIIAIIGTAFLSGCASNLKESAWYSIRNTGVSFEQAIASCEYDMEKLDLGSGRASMAIVGLQHPTFEKCMNRFGFAWQKNEQANQKVQQNSQPKVNEISSEEAQKTEALRQSAEKGDVVAQVNLAYRYLIGSGVNQSNTLAYQWYTKASDKIDVNSAMSRNAQANLGVIWSDGLGVQKDNVKAMMWFMLASSNNEVEATKRRQRLETLMLENEIKEAKRLAVLCVAKKYKNCEEAVSTKWKICEATNTYSANKDIAKILETWNLTIVFGKNIDNADARLVLLYKSTLNESLIVDLDVSENGLFEGKNKFTSYKPKKGFGNVEESKEDGNLFIRIGKTTDSSFDVRTQCK